MSVARLDRSRRPPLRSRIRPLGRPWYRRGMLSGDGRRRKDASRTQRLVRKTTAQDNRVLEQLSHVYALLRPVWFRWRQIAPIRYGASTSSAAAALRLADSQISALLPTNHHPHLSTPNYTLCLAGNLYLCGIAMRCLLCCSCLDPVADNTSPSAMRRCAL